MGVIIRCQLAIASIILYLLVKHSGDPSCTDFRHQQSSFTYLLIYLFYYENRTRVHSKQYTQ